MNVLISDDQNEYGQSLVDLIEQKCDGVAAHHLQNWEEAITEISRAEKFYDLVIIDGKGQLNADSSSNDDSHALKAHTDLSKLKLEGRILEYVINTGYHDDFQTFKSAGVQIFRKPEDQNNLIDFINQLSEVNHLLKLKTGNEKAFLGAEIIKGAEGQIRLFEILQAFESKDYNFQKIREFVENLIDWLVENGHIPKLESNGERDVANSIRYISGQKVFGDNGRTLYDKDNNRRIIDKSIEQCIGFIWRCSSAIEHDGMLGNKRKYEALSLSLLEVLEFTHLNFNR